MAEVLRGELQLIAMPKVVFGPGRGPQAIAAEVSALGAKRALIVTGNTLANKTDLVERVKQALGASCVGVFSGTIQHVPRETVLAGVEVARDEAADALVAVGGSTPMDTARGIALVIAEGPDFDHHRTRFEPPDKRVVPSLPNSKLPLLSIPTTLSGGEFTYGFGISNKATRAKEVFMDPKLTPKAVILDPEMTAATSNELWAGTGMKILCDCIEVVCSPRHQPYSDALVSAAARTLFHDLPVSIGQPPDLAARARLQYAALMVMNMFMVIGVGLASSLRHQIGAMWGVPHGIASSIAIPHVMAFNRPAVAERLGLIAEAAGIQVAGRNLDAVAQDAIAAVANLAKGLGLPARLRDVGASRSEFEAIAEHVLGDYSTQTNPRTVTSKEQVLEVLENAY